MKCAKDPLPADQQPGAIYAMGCKDCKKVLNIYVGETTRTAEQRAKEHHLHTRTGNANLSAVAAHANQEVHEIHWTLSV